MQPPLPAYEKHKYIPLNSPPNSFFEIFCAGVGAAFSVLSDADKRAHYDRFGAEEASGASTGDGGRNFSRSQHYARYEEEIRPEDIFNMFFGGGGLQGGVSFGGPGGFVRPQRRPQHHHPAQHHQQGGPRFAQLLQLLPLLLLFLFSLISLRGGSEERVFGLARDETFRQERKTSLYGVTPGLPYFVRDDFRTRVSLDRTLMSKVC